MCQVARKTNRLLAVGHQRHYSVLYDNANYLVQNDVLGDIRHIRALWHRNNATPLVAKDKNGNPIFDPKTGLPEIVHDEQGKVVYRDSWKRIHTDLDKNIDYKKYGYKSLDELINWRLYNRTGAGLMAELGSHQLDACSIFLGKKHPLAVTGIGGTFFYTDGREVDDHVFTLFEFPGKGEKDRVVVTYSSINTNSFDGYGEMVMGSKGTMIVSQEKEILLYKEAGNPACRGRTSVTVEAQGKKPALETSPSTAGPTAAAALGGLATADPVARLSRRARAFRLLRAPRQCLELSRRQRAPAALPRRGRPGRRRHRAHEQHRHAAEPADRLRPALVRLQVARDPGRARRRSPAPKLSRAAITCRAARSRAAASSRASGDSSATSSGSNRLDADLPDPGGIGAKDRQAVAVDRHAVARLASRPSRSSTSPPAVSASVSGNCRWQVSARTSSGHEASTSKTFSPSGVIGGVSRSNSSWIGPDQLFEHVFKSHHAGDAAVLVEQHRQVNPVALKFEQELVEPQG